MDDLVIQEFVNAIKEDPTETNTTYNATVSRIDNEGVVWVNLHGSEKETPTASTSSEVKRGDAVTVNWRNNKLYIGGNYSNPSVGISTVKPSVDYVTEMISKAITVNSINAATGYIETLESNNITAENISADHAAISTLDATYATIEELHSGYAEIDLANVNNAWIEDGVIKDAAISDAQIIGVSANKLTAGTIDASNINVTNLNADNITAGSITVDGITIDIENNEANIDGAYIEDGTITMNGLAQSVQNAIDGAIETYTGTVVPTLNNSPASSWTTTKLKDSHIGDIYYVINAGHEADGYCYRFAKSGSTYSWVLIQDSDVTAALSRLTTAEGKIEGLESFESETSSWMTDTDEELSSVKSNVTSLTGRMTTAEGNIQQKVDTSTFNTLSQTVDENTADITSLTTITENNGLTSSTNITNTVNQVSQTASGNSSKISQLTTTLGTNADGTTKDGDIVHQVSAIDQDLDSITTRVATTEVRINGTYATSSTGSGTTAKVATITPAVTGWTLYTGATITVKFTNANTATAPTLNVNSTGAKSIRTFEAGTLAEKDYKWNAGDTFTFVYNGTYWLMQEATTRLKTAEASITTNAGNIALKANATDVYSKTDANALLEVKANKDTLTSEINASADTVLIDASRVNIAGAAIFSSYATKTEAQGYATTAKNEAIAEIPTDVSELNNDSGYQTSSQVDTAITSKGYQTASDVSTAVTNGVSGKADKTAAVAEEQYRYISKASGTTSVSGTTTWVSRSDDVQNTWTTKRPTYSTSYPVLFVAKQKKTVSGTVTCTTPVKDDTTTVIDGGHITTGTIDASRLNVSDIISSGHIAVTSDIPTNVSDLTNDSGFITSAAVPTKVSDLTNDSGYQTSSQVSSAISTATSDMATNTSVANTYATKAAANAQEQLIYKSAVSGTTSMSGTTTWITSTSDTQNAWTTKRPTYNSSYPVLFIATQRKSVSGTVTCTTPMIDDTTTIIDGGHIITGTVTANQIASAAVTADKLAANSITVGKMDAETQAMMPWTSDVESVPYLLRQSAGGTIDHDFTGEYDKIVGGTVAWNQWRGENNATYTTDGITTSYSNGKFSITNNSRTTNYSSGSSRNSIYNKIIQGHKYVCFGASSKSIVGVGIVYRNGSSSYVFAQINTVFSASSVSSSDKNVYLRIDKTYDFTSTHPVNDVTEFTLNICDLTQMFGSTIADYIYNLETTTAGAGVAFFRKLFPNDYYAYDAGTLKSVEGLSEHVMRDADDNIIGEYPLDSSLTLRGIPKLNGNNLYYDGDTYESDGTVTRKYGIVDLGTLTWSHDGNSVFRLTGNIGAKLTSNTYSLANLICSIYPTYPQSGMANKSVAGLNWGYGVRIKDETYGSDTAAFKSAMSGVYLVYELATPTTETATSYASPQAVIPQGTEEYVTTGIVPVGHETTYASGSTVNAGIVASTQINSAIQDTQSYTDDVTSTLSDSLTESISQTSTELSGKIDEVRTLANSKADSSALNSLSLQMQEYIGEGGYIYAQNGTLIIATGQNIGNFKIGLTGQQIVFYENDVAVAYIEGKKMYITRSEVTDEQKISNFAFKKRDGGRFTLMYVGG